jgi:hypothetical protein
MSLNYIQTNEMVCFMFCIFYLKIGFIEEKIDLRLPGTRGQRTMRRIALFRGNECLLMCLQLYTYSNCFLSRNFLKQFLFHANHTLLQLQNIWEGDSGNRA